MNRIEFQTLTTQQKYAYTFERASSALVNRGFKIEKLSEDPHKAYFIVKNPDGFTFCKVLIKTRLRFEKRYVGQGIYSCFTHDNKCYFYNHGELLEKMMQTGVIIGTPSWENKDDYHFPHL